MKTLPRAGLALTMCSWLVPLTADASGPSALSDLLHTTRASVAVSSNVDNPRDYPDHLLDGDEETAWNGRTGDLTTGFIKFQVPDDATVDHLEMSAGFDKIGKDPF